MNERRSSGVTWLMVAVATMMAVFIAVVASRWTASIVSAKSHMAVSASNARQIVRALKLYAADHGGSYPEGVCSSNDAFRALYVDGILPAGDEKIFTAPNSPFKGDNITGPPPSFPQALEAGENHWAMVAGLTDSSPGNAPVIFDNPADPAWPPTWNADATESPVKGRAWKGGRIIVASNDGSVEVLRLASKTGTSVLVALGPGGKDCFTALSPHGTILDILVR